MSNPTRLKTLLQSSSLRTFFPSTRARTQRRFYFATTPRHQKKTFEESVITLEKDIANLFVDEQKNISQIDTSSYIKYCDELLASTGLKFTTNPDGKVSLSGGNAGRNFVITWDPNYRFDEIIEDEEEEEAVASDDENETNDAEVEPDFNNDTDELHEENSSFIEVRIEKENGQTINLKCGIENDTLCVYSIGTSAASSISLLSSGDFTETLRSKIHQYLTELKIGTETVDFIQSYNQDYITKNHKASLAVITKFFDKL